MISRTKMLEISALVLVLQIGFNVALNYRGYNYNPLIPSPRFLNYGQARRFYPARYLSVPSSRSPASDSEQSESEEASLEDSGYRMSSDHNRPYLRYNDYLKYSTAAENSASLELAPVGGVSFNSYADLLRSALYNRNRADANLRRAFLRNRLQGYRRAHNRKKSHRKEDVESSVEAPVKDKSSRRDHSEHRSVVPPAEQPEESEYFHSLLALMERANARRDQEHKYRIKDDDDISLESFPNDKINVDDNVAHNRRSSYEVDLDEVGSADPLLADIEEPENRRVNLQKTVISRPFNYDENSNSQKSLSSPLEKSNNRRQSKKDGSLAENKRSEMPYPERDGPDAYLDTVLILSDEGKPDDITFAKPQLRDSKASKVKDSNKNNRKKYEDSNLNVLPNNGVELEELTSNKLPAVQKSKSNRRRHKQGNNSPKRDKSRRDNKNSKSLQRDRLNPNDDADDKQSVQSLADVNELNLESKRRNYDEKPISNRRDDDDDDDESPSVSLDDRLNPDDDNGAFDLSQLLAEGLDDLQILPTLLRSNGLSNLKNDKNDYKLAILDLSELDKLSPEDDSLNNLSILRSLSMDNIDLESSVKINNNKNPLSARRIGDEVGVELVLTDKLGPDNKDVDELVPYHETSLKSDDPSLDENENRRNNDDEDIEIPSNNRRSHNDFELSVLSLSGPDVKKASSRNVDPFSSNKDKLTRRHSENKHNLDDIIAEIFGTSLDYIKKNKVANLRNSDDEAYGKNSMLHLEFPWNGALSPGNKGESVSNREPPSRLRTNSHLVARQDDYSNPNKYELKLEYPWNGQQNPDKDDKATAYFKRRNSNRRSYYDPLRVLPLKHGLHNDDLSFLESFENGYDSQSYLRHTSNFDDNLGLRVLTLARTNEDNDTDILPNSLEDPSFITFPLDRRPHLRLMPRNNDVNKLVDAKRRANTPVETNTAAPKTDALTTIEVTTEKALNSTTISPSK